MTQGNVDRQAVCMTVLQVQVHTQNQGQHIVVHTQSAHFSATAKAAVVMFAPAAPAYPLLVVLLLTLCLSLAHPPLPLSG